jgi:hypothetical protein
MKTTYFLSNRKNKDWEQLTRQIEMFCLRKGIPLDANIFIEISESMIFQTGLTTVKITIT